MRLPGLRCGGLERIFRHEVQRPNVMRRFIHRSRTRASAIPALFQSFFANVDPLQLSLIWYDSAELRAILDGSCADFRCAMRTAEDLPIFLHAVPNHAATAMATPGCQRLDRAFKAVESVCLAGQHHFEGFVVFIPAGFTLSHNRSLVLRGKNQRAQCRDGARLRRWGEATAAVSGNRLPISKRLVDAPTRAWRRPRRSFHRDKARQSSNLCIPPRATKRRLPRNRSRLSPA